MSGWHFDAEALARAESDPTHDPYNAVGEMMRDYLSGGDILAEVRRRARRDPQLRAMISHAAELIRPTIDVEPEKGWSR